MNIFSTNPLYCLALLLVSLLLVPANEYDNTLVIPDSSSKVRNYTFHVNRTVLAPDGFKRRVWTVNGQFPGPPIYANLNDTISVKVINELDGEQTAFHWHGMLQRGTPWFDGAAAISQCGIPSGKEITYEFTASTAGTYWWHAHYMGQYVDGLLGSLIVYDPKDPFRGKYDKEYTVLISWWYHNESSYLSSIVETDHGPEPDGGLINGRFRYDCSLAPPGSQCTSNTTLSKFKFEKGKKYRLRVINTSADGKLNFSINNHSLTVIEVDGFYVQPYKTQRIVTSPGQRYSVIVEANQPVDNYCMRADFDDLDPGLPINRNVTAIISYEGAEDKEPKCVTSNPWDDNEMLDDETVLEPYYDQKVPESETQYILHVNVTDNKAIINNSTYIPDFDYSTLQKVYDYQNLSAANWTNQNQIIYDKPGQVIDFVMQNDDTEAHPFHMHGHKFYIMGRGNGTYVKEKTTLIKNPIQRDTTRLTIQGYTILRITADNPGIWPFHCHIEWHFEMGMAVQLVELPSSLRKLKEAPSIASLCPKKMK